MNTRDLITTIRGRQGLSAEDAERLFTATIATLKEDILRGDTVTIYGFGQFEQKTKKERISVNPATGERMLVPPKISLSFKPSTMTKDRLNGRDGGEI